MAIGIVSTGDIHHGFRRAHDGASLGGVHSTPLGPFCSVTDLLNGETVAEDADRFTCRFAAPDTRLFDIQR